MLPHKVKDCLWFNNHYYIINETYETEIFDKKHNHINTYKVPKKFTSFTCDNLENCFYFNDKNEPQSLYKTNDFKSFDTIKIQNNEPILNISYCKCLNGLLITTSKKIILFNLITHNIKALFEIKEFFPLCDCMGPLGCNNDSKITLISAICCNKKILVAYKYKNMSYISELRNNWFGEVLHETFDYIKRIFVIEDEVWSLVDNGCKDEIVYTAVDCKCRDSKDCNIQIIESIASIEKSIAKILESESIKIKSTVDKTDNINDLICVNSSVKEVIYYVTILEFMLIEKLKLVKKDNEKDCC